MASGSSANSDRHRSAQHRYHPRGANHDQAHAQDKAEFVETTSRHPLACTSKPQLIISEPELAELLDHLRNEGSFAYDSEFIGEASYVPQLCLVQAASSKRVALIDPLAQIDLRPFWELVADPKIEKIVHAGEQDVEPLFRTIGKPPANLFDTQIAGGMIGLGYPISLSKLLHTLVGVKLAKGLTLTQWDRRPLTEQQLRYAADDVRYLPAVRFEMGRSLEKLGHMEWAREESAQLADPTAYGFNPETHFLKIRGSGNLPPRNQAVLRELTIWRNQAARAEDLPPRAMLKDEILLGLARSPIRSVNELSRIRGLPRPVETEHGAEIVSATARAMSLPDEQLPEDRGHEPAPQEKFRADALNYAAQSLCAGRQIDPALVVSRQEIGQLYALATAGKDTSALPIMKGWRRAAVGQYLLDLLAGKLTIESEWFDGCLKTTAQAD